MVVGLAGGKRLADGPSLSHSWLSPSQSKTWESTDIVTINKRQKVSFYRKIDAFPVFEGISQHKQINNLEIVVTLRVGKESGFWDSLFVI